MKKAIIFCTLLSTVCANAQTVDSIFIPENQFLKNYENLIWNNPIQSSEYPIKDYTKTSVSGEFSDLGIKRVQTPSQINKGSFNTSGIFNVNPNLRVVGSFDYSLSQEKNMGYNLSNRRTTSELVLNPNYLWVPKSSNWETQNYQVSAGGHYKLKNLYLGTTIFYNNQSSFRKTDPRPSISTADYQGNIFIGYGLNGHQLSATGGLGRKTENNDVISVNENINTPSDPDHFVRFSNGYGRMIYFSSFRKFIYRTQSYNYGGGYAFKNEKINIGAQYKYNWSMENLYSRDANENVYIDNELVNMKYRVINHDFSGFLHFKYNNTKFLSDFGAKIKTGDNYNVREEGQNFKLTSDIYYFNIQALHTNSSNMNTGVRLESSYGAHRVKDLLGVTDKKLTNLDLKLVFNKDIYQFKDAKINLEVSAMQYVALQNLLQYVPASSSQTLYENVLLPDYYYDDLNKTGFGTEISFFSKFIKNTNIRIYSNFATWSASNKNTNIPSETFTTPNTYFSTGITIYY